MTGALPLLLWSTGNVLKLVEKWWAFKIIPQKSRGEMLKSTAVSVPLLFPLLQTSRGNRHIRARLPFSPFPTDRERGQFINTIPGSNVRRACGLLPLKRPVTSFYAYVCWFYFTSIKLLLIRFPLGLTLDCTILTQLFMWRSFLWPSTLPVSPCPS